MVNDNINNLIIGKEYLIEKTLIEQIKLIKKLIKNYPDDTRCKKCLVVYFWHGCPHCGNTFLNREILRQSY